MLVIWSFRVCKIPSLVLFETYPLHILFYKWHVKVTRQVVVVGGA